ncbi:BaiN/RdsA family NAD(P)/FAD-dependent oxidoreductase [Flavobacterium silvaticum]
MKQYDVIIIGGGAAGFFTAINTAQINPKLKIAIFERGREVLTKVRISGGGRCNVTHACFEPNELVKFYPRGEKELRGPFHTFCSGDTIEWFEKRGVNLKIEEDGRMFPVTDSSQTIIDCFITETQKYGIEVLTGQSVQSLFHATDGWKIETPQDQFKASKILIAAGSNPKIWDMLHELGHTIVPAVPSLFTFNINDTRIKDLPGVSAQASVMVNGTKLEASGPLLITHWGMSGPAILKLSAWGARILADKNYQFGITVNWLDHADSEEAETILKSIKSDQPKKSVGSKSPFGFPNRLWESIVKSAQISSELKWADMNKAQLQALATALTSAKFSVNGKSTFKEEFVTAGGIDLKEVNFKTMESKLLPGIFFAGEILDIDAITGGFNFQNAWTGGFIAAKSLSI